MEHTKKQSNIKRIKQTDKQYDNEKHALRTQTHQQRKKHKKDAKTRNEHIYKQLRIQRQKNKQQHNLINT